MLENPNSSITKEELIIEEKEEKFELKENESIKLDKVIQCYTCGKNYQEIHFFYDKLCPNCAKLNYEKRFQSCDLKNKIALVTGKFIQ
jgi:hypothetical protein